MLSLFKSLALGTALAAASVIPGHAAILFPTDGNFGLLTNPGLHSLPFAGFATGPSFTDLYSFSLDNTDAVSIKFGGSFGNLSEEITNYTVSLYSGTTPSSGSFITSTMADIVFGAVKNAGGESGLLTATLGAGSYSFLVSGVTKGSEAYSGVVSVSLSPVPLPASAPMFGAALLALGAVGYGVKRKKAAAAA